MKHSKPNKPARSNVTSKPAPQQTATKIGPDPFAKLGLSEREREKLAAVGRLSSLAPEPKATAFFIRLGSDSMSPKETKPDAQLG
jgi:hypothetical protein